MALKGNVGLAVKRDRRRSLVVSASVCRAGGQGSIHDRIAQRGQKSKVCASHLGV